jgi:hypothetical protein
MGSGGPSLAPKDGAGSVVDRYGNSRARIWSAAPELPDRIVCGRHLHHADERTDREGDEDECGACYGVEMASDAEAD